MNVTPSHSCDLSPSNLSKLRSLSRMSSYDPLYYDSLLSPERNNDDTITEDDVFTAEEAKYPKHLVWRIEVTDQLIAYVSRTLSTAEKKYCHL